MTKKLSHKGRRQKGHQFERDIANDFRELGFEAMTTRAGRGGSWSQSDNGIDLMGTEPFAVQCKRWEKYASVDTIEEIQDPECNVCGFLPLLLTKADGKPTMAVLPWAELKKLIRAAYPKS